MIDKRSDRSGCNFIVSTSVNEEKPPELCSNYRLFVKIEHGVELKTIQKSSKLDNVCYDIRGPVLEKARQMEEEGHKIIKLNIGNLAVFGFDAPEEIQQDIIRNLPGAAAYPPAFCNLLFKLWHLSYFVGAASGNNQIAMQPETTDFVSVVQ